MLRGYLGKNISTFDMTSHHFLKFLSIHNVQICIGERFPNLRLFFPYEGACQLNKVSLTVERSTQTAPNEEVMLTIMNLFWEYFLKQFSKHSFLEQFSKTIL